MSAQCATASVRIAQTAALARVGANRFTGDFYNAEYAMSGTITITVHGNKAHNASLAAAEKIGVLRVEQVGALDLLAYQSRVFRAPKTCMTPISRRALLSSAGAFSLIPRTAGQPKMRLHEDGMGERIRERETSMTLPPERKDRYSGRWDRDRWDKGRWERNDGRGFEYCIPVPFHDFDHYYTLGRLTWTAAERRANDRTLRAAAASTPSLYPKDSAPDLASVPQAFWSLLPKNGRHVYAAIIHDYLYWRQKTSRLKLTRSSSSR